MTTALYAFSGDPITFGHLDIINRAAHTFDQLIVAIGVNPNKKYTFSLQERELMAKESVTHLKNVTVASFTGLLIDFAYEQGVSIIIKGVRDQADFDYEKTLFQIGETHKLGIDTHLLFANPKLSHVSSSTVKEIQKAQGMIHEYVPLFVKQFLEARISDQYILGVTGEIGVGKTWVSHQLVDLGQQAGISVTNIELDQIGHDILQGSSQPGYKKVRLELSKTFGSKIRNKDGTINRKRLGEIVFREERQLSKLNQIMHTPLLVKLRRELQNKKGLILLNAALIAESDMAYLSNNNILLVKTNQILQRQRLKKKKFTDQQIKRRLASQHNFQQKKKKLNKIIRRDQHGQLWTLDNSQQNTSTEQLFKKIKAFFKL